MTSITPALPQAYKLMHEGILALAQAERYGICVDVPYCERKLQHISRQMSRLEKQILQEPEVQAWRKKWRSKFNLTSNEQLEKVLFTDLKIKPPKLTENSKDLEESLQKGATDKESLSQIDLPFVKMILETRRLKTVYDDLSGILKEQVNGVLHPHFNLHLADTYRSTSSDPNFQNMPIRDPLQGSIIRSAFLPRPGHVLLEIDYGGIEVKVAACYHKDPTMLSYIHDSSKDMHRDMASQIYKLEDAPPEYWKDKTPGGGKDVRYNAKNKYVFPEFYGSYYVECAKNLWDAIDQMKLVNPEGVPLKEHLKVQGIRNYKAFEKHVQNVEKDFWERRFKVYSNWKDSWWEKYLATGTFSSLTGFSYGGMLRRNQVINYPVQGSAFHCLLWSFTRITEEANKRGWVSRPVGQIHDSIILDVDPVELNEVMEVCQRIMCEDIRKFWPWIIVPLDIEAECCVVDGNWHGKKELHAFKCECGIGYCHKIFKDNSVVYKCPVCEKEYQIN